LSGCARVSLEKRSPSPAFPDGFQIADVVKLVDTLS
jgi:hypothetical protein